MTACRVTAKDPILRAEQRDWSALSWRFCHGRVLMRAFGLVQHTQFVSYTLTPSWVCASAVVRHPRLPTLLVRPHRNPVQRNFLRPSVRPSVRPSETGLFFLSFLWPPFWSEATKVDITTAVRPISHVKSNAAALIREINETRKPIVITQNGEARGVLVDPRS